MNNNIRSKIKQFLKSEEGRANVKAPLALGIASGSLLLMLTSVQAESFQCYSDEDCESGEFCAFLCNGVSFNGSCLGEWYSKCTEIP